MHLCQFGMLIYSTQNRGAQCTVSMLACIFSTLYSMVMCSSASHCTSNMCGTAFTGHRGYWPCCSCISIAQSGQMTSGQQAQSFCKSCWGPSGLSILPFVVNLIHSGPGSKHCNALSRSNTVLRYWNSTVSVRVNEMPSVQQSISSSTKLLLLDSLLDLLGYIIS